MLEPQSGVSSVVYQIAEPLKNIIVVRVTMKDGMSNRVVQTPLSAPMARPTATKASDGRQGMRQARAGEVAALARHDRGADARWPWR